MLCNRIFSNVSTTIFFVVIITSTLIIFKISNFEASEAMNHTQQYIERSGNETMQNKNESTNNTSTNNTSTNNTSTNNTSTNNTSTNNTGEAILPSKNGTDLGSNLTEVAKKLAKSIDDGLKNLSNKSNPSI
jgi:hypothetical protein